MAPPDQASDAAAEMPCTCGRDEEPVRHHQHHHDRTLSSIASFSSSLTASPAPSTASSSSSSSTNYLPASSNKLSCDSIPYYAGAPDLSSFSSTASSYESFFHIEALDAADDFGPDAAAAVLDNSENEFLEFDPTATSTTTLPPAVQTMLPQQKSRRHKAADGGAANAAAYDPKRLPSSMFRTRSTNPAEWSATSNESLFSIQLSSSGDDATAAQFADLYYDAAGFPRFPSLGRDATLPPLGLPSSSSSSSSEGRSGGLCVRHDCARCSTGGKTRKSVRFAAVESVVAGDGKHSAVVVTTLAVELEETETEEAPAAAAVNKSPPAAGWCELGCCSTVWWPRCCGCNECGCHCRWWF